jgi:CheY-like chemotaxis protein
MSKKILFADDEEDIVRVVSFRLNKAGFQVITVPDGEQALEVLKKQKIDLALLDLRMPNVGGEQVCRFIKETDGFKHIPVILLTATAHLSLAEKAKSVKADAFVGKPFDFNDLLERVKSLLD